VNIEKQDALPAVWAAKAFPNEQKRVTYFDENDLDGLPLDLVDFLSFYELRKARVRSRLLKALGTSRVE
jgi:hypothetical protein